MNRSMPYFGTIAALGIVLFVAALSGAPTAPQTLSVSTTTPVIVSNVPETASITAIVATTTASIAPSPVVLRAKKAVSQKVHDPAPVQSAAPVAAQPVLTEAMFDSAALALRDALVNIICYAPPGSGLRSISGSGIFIDSKGIILTNAHVAQSFLFANRGVSCTIRSGGPATAKYEAALIYISPSWIRANAAILTQKAPSGNGEYDFALLAVTKSATSVPLPIRFPFVPLAQSPAPSGTPVIIASYGAQFLESDQIQSSLFPTIVFGSIKKIFTFATTTVDVFSLGGSAAAQEGSSGGGVADMTGTLIGTITTSTVTGTTDTRVLSAITASYIRAEYTNETGEALDLLLAQTSATSIANFAPQLPALEAILTAPLP